MNSKKHDTLSWLVGGGEMTELIQAKDWSKTPLGPMESWPQSLRTTVSLCLASNFPINIIWGKDAIQIYNDGYKVVCGSFYNEVLGGDYRITWKSAWPTIGGAFNKARNGETSYLENQRMFLERNGYPEETFFTFSISPIRDESGGIAGLFHPVTETTVQMLGERRLRALRDIGSQSVKALSIEAVCKQVAKVLSNYQFDLPFTVIYLFDKDGLHATRIGQAGLKDESKLNPLKINLKNPEYPISDLLQTTQITIIDDFEKRFGKLNTQSYPEPIQKAFYLPIVPIGLELPIGFLLCGISTRLPLNDSYKTFYEMLLSAVHTEINRARVFEVEKKRAEALAEIDRAKTAFFSNVSHEFRTPLTLMLGPTEDLLAETKGKLPPFVRAEAEVIHRNALRLLRLVNALLDFSRIEANRAQANYEQVDLGVVTRDLASSFRSAIERAGMKLKVTVDEFKAPVFVDRDMWDKIVLNLLSNAFKYTLKGEIEVSLKSIDDKIEFSVRDTGAGIPQEDLKNVFQRFYRVKGSVGRTHEGTGIGLALVQELVKLHGGTIEVKSELGEGSRFTVKLPQGSAHLPHDRISKQVSTSAPTKKTSESYVEEALRWLPSDSDVHLDVKISESPIRNTSTKKSVMLVDDNADMRDYVKNLLVGRYHVTTASNGEEALKIIRVKRPDLIVSDIMMPIMNGIELLKAIRRDQSLETLPVIFLSARAGEEAKTSGIESGADDYLTKPFSAKELLARVQTQLNMAEVRQKAAEQEAQIKFLGHEQKWLESILDLMPTPLLLIEPGSGKVTFANRSTNLMAGGKFPMGVPAAEYERSYLVTDDKGMKLSPSEMPASRAAKGEMVKDAEIVWRTPIGDFTLLVDSEFAPPLEGHPPRIILCLRDITKMKDIQRELKTMINLRDDFLSIASHELRTPLTSLYLQLQLVEKMLKNTKESEAALPPKLTNKVILSNMLAKQLSDMIDSLLDVSRIRSGKIAINRQEVDLGEVVQHAVTSLSELAKIPGSQIIFHGHKAVVGNWDKGKILQAISNIISNAIKYGEGKPVDVYLSSNSDQAVVRVKDHGMGISLKDQKRIFERFERAISHRNISGMGLGLYIAKEIVTAHGGSITVESELEKGSTFVLTIPLGAELTNHDDNQTLFKTGDNIVDTRP